jgi:hypothetical protein
MAPAGAVALGAGTANAQTTSDAELLPNVRLEMHHRRAIMGGCGVLIETAVDHFADFGQRRRPIYLNFRTSSAPRSLRAREPGASRAANTASRSASQISVALKSESSRTISTASNSLSRLMAPRR